MKDINIIEAKIVLDWAKENLKRTGNPKHFCEAQTYYNKVSTIFDSACEDWVNDNYEKINNDECEL